MALHTIIYFVVVSNWMLLAGLSSQLSKILKNGIVFLPLDLCPLILSSITV